MTTDHLPIGAAMRDVVPTDDAGTVAARTDTAARLLRLARELQAIGQTGLRYAGDDHIGRNHFDEVRYARVVDLAAELFDVLGGQDPEGIALAFDRDHGHMTPKIDVRGVLADGDRVLLVRERSDGGWTLPGGWADVNEGPADTVTREVWEETGLRTRAASLLAVFDRDNHHALAHVFSVWKVFVECEVVGGEIRTETDETDGCGWWPVDDLPPLSEPRVTAAQIRRCHALCADPSTPRVALFD